MTRRQFRILSTAGVLCPATTSARNAHRVGSRAYPVSPTRVICKTCLQVVTVAQRLAAKPAPPSKRPNDHTFDALTHAMQRTYNSVAAQLRLTQENALYSQLKANGRQALDDIGKTITVPLSRRPAADGHGPSQAQTSPADADDPARRRDQGPG